MILMFPIYVGPYVWNVCAYSDKCMYTCLYMFGRSFSVLFIEVLRFWGPLKMSFVSFLFLLYLLV